MAAALALLVSACGGSIEDTIARTKDTSLTAHQRCVAIDDLAIEGRKAVAPLHELTRDPDVKVAKCARKAIAAMFDADAASAMIPLLQDRDPRVVVSAAEALGRMGEDVSVPALVPLLASPNRAVVVAAIAALGQIGDPSALPDLEKVAVRRGATPAEDEAGRSVRSAAVAALGSLGDPRARGTLVRVLSGDPASSRAAGAALTVLFQDDVTPLLPLLEDRRNIALAFALVDVGQPGTQEALVTALQRYGGVGLARYYLNCGEGTLEKAARQWAHNHGYSVLTTPGIGGGDQWGSASD